MPEGNQITSDVDQEQEDENQSINFASIYFGSNADEDDMRTIRRALRDEGYEVRTDMVNDDNKPKQHIDKEVE